jgi:hypothetical protein
MSSVVALPIPLSLPHVGELVVERYTVARKREWDGFVRTAKNATFLFYRDYLDYHQDRFSDFSLMVYHGNKLLALMPANLAAAGTLVSHEGLTYGGLALRRSAALVDVLACVQSILHYLHEHRITRLLYKRLPAFYNTTPDDDILYAFFLLGARLYRRDCALVINQAERLNFRRGRKGRINKARRLGLRIAQDTNFLAFWEQLLVPRLLSRYHARPTHTVEEITLLASRFPLHIKQFSAYCGQELVAGASNYQTPKVAHAQYNDGSDEARSMNALDCL